MATDVLVVLVTAPDAEQGAALGRRLVEERLCACANLVPGVRSIYRWQGEVQDDAEVLLLLKTQREHLPALTRRVEALHPYDTPEVLALPVEAGAAAYLAWVDANTGDP